MRNGAPEGYLTYPASPKKLYDKPPASGGTISILKNGDVPLPAPVDKNVYWQELNKRVGAELKITQLASDYSAKLATTIAGGDLPDMLRLPAQAHMLDLLKAKFQDLSPWLAGDKIKDYPSLAAQPSWGWPGAVYGDGIWGIQWCFGSLAGSENRIRQDIFDELGVKPQLSNGQDLLDLCAALTDDKRNRWAIGDLNSSAVAMVKEMVGVPNGWRVDGGKFTADYETDEYKEMLDQVNKIWKKGYVYPDASTTLVRGQELFLAGQAAMLRQAYTNWPFLANRGSATDKNFKQSGLILPKWDGGGQAAHFLTSGYTTMLVLKKASDERIEELLRVLDWFAAPFGSEEYLFIEFGVPDRDYKLTGSDPISTATGTNECRNMFMTYIAGAPLPLYSAGLPDETKAQYDELGKLMDVTVPLPTAGLYSETALGAGQTVTKNITDLQNDILSGRKPLSAWDGGVRSWRSAGGDKMRSEYEEAYAAAH
jgi:putative aldouronate transport system substrate-binding protein